MNKQQTLKPCPFCGSNKIDIGWDDYGSLKCIYLYHCYCDDCLSKTQELHTEQEAIEAWNTRPEKPQSALEMFRDMYSENFTDEFESLVCKYFENEAFVDAVFVMVINHNDEEIKAILTKIKGELER